MSSLSAVLTLLAGAVALFVPGLILAFLLRLRGMLAWSIAPAITLMMAGGLAVFYSLGGVPFNPVTFACGIAIVAAITELFARVFRLPKFGRGISGRKTRFLFGILILLATFVPVFPLLFFYGLDQPIQHMDPAFHMNAVYLVEQTEKASSFHDLTRMWGLDTTPTTIPAGAHAFISLFATKNTIIQATNSMFVLNSAVWALGIATLALVAFPGNTWIPFAAVSASTLVVEYPTYLHSAYPILPNATTLAVLPGVLAWIYAIVFRRFRPDQVHLERRAMIGWIVAVAAVISALMLTHPSVALNVLVLMVLPLLFGWFNRIKDLVRDKRWRALIIQMIVAISIILIPSLSLLNDYVMEKVVQMLTTYNTFPNPSLGAVVKTYGLWPIYTVADASPWLVRIQVFVQYIVIFLTTVGIIAILRKAKKQRVLLWSALGMATITVTTMIRTGPLVTIAGFWYMSIHRAMSAQAVPQIVIMGYGLVVTSQLLVRFYARVRNGCVGVQSQIPSHQISKTSALMIVIVTLIGTVLTQPARYSFIQRVYDPESNHITHVASADELAMMKHLRPKLNDGLVIGDPFNGSTLLQSYGSGEVVFPQPYYRPENEDENFLKDHFDKIHVNRKICQMLDEMNVKYFYYDSDGWNYLENSRLAAPGFYEVDTSVGFTKIAEGGSAKLFRIDVCEKWNH